MRVTTFGMTSQFLNDLNSIQDRMNTSMQQLTTGRRINKPSDDPVGTVLDMQLRTTMSNVQQWQKNASDAQVWFSTTESTLTDVENSLQRIRTLLIEANNTMLDPSDRMDIADNIDQLRENIEQLANTKIGDQYIFGGTNTTQPPLSVSTNGSTTTYTWNGNEGTRNYEFGVDIQIQVNTDGKAIFMNAPTGASAGLLDTLQNISNHLRDPNVTSNTLSNDLGDIDAHLNNVIAQIAELGAKQNRVTALQNQFSQTLTSLQQRLSDVEDADMADVISHFQNQQTVYLAALETAQRMILPTLADYLK